MTAGNNRAVVIDTMVVSALMNSAHDPTAARYLSLIAGRLILVSFVTVTEMRYGALRTRWGDLRRRGLERDLARFVFVVPDDTLMHARAELRATTERAGHPLGQKIHEADRWIAATAMQLGVELASDEPASVRGGRLAGVEIHESPDDTPNLFVQMRAHDGAFWFSAGGPGSYVHSGRWLPDKVRARTLNGRELSPGFTATGSRGSTQVRAPDGLTVEFRRERWLRVAAYRAATGEEIAEFKVFAWHSFVSVADSVSESKLSSLVVAMASGVVLLTRPCPTFAVVVWLLPGQRPVLRTARSEEKLARQLLGRIPLAAE